MPDAQNPDPVEETTGESVEETEVSEETPAATEEVAPEAAEAEQA